MAIYSPYGPRERGTDHSQIASSWITSHGLAQEPYAAITLTNYREVSQVRDLPADVLHGIEVVGRVLPFKSNHYVVDHLIDWDDVPNDPMYTQLP